jgi:hypothetical protein
MSETRTAENKLTQGPDGAPAKPEERTGTMHTHTPAPHVRMRGTIETKAAASGMKGKERWRDES